MNKNFEDNINATLADWIKSIIFALILAIIIKTFVFSSTIVIGLSMSPTLNNGDRLLVNKLFFAIDNVKQGDIVEINAPDDEYKDYIKRVIALEGDQVAIKDGQVYINGVRLKENYTSTSQTLPYQEDSWVVEDNHVFLLGDNREPGASKDSRYFGTISKDDIVGIAFYRFYPFGSRMGKL